MANSGSTDSRTAARMVCDGDTSIDVFKDANGEFRLTQHELAEFVMYDRVDLLPEPYASAVQQVLAEDETKAPKAKKAKKSTKKAAKKEPKK